jgi:homocitrate synthase NifV
MMTAPLLLDTTLRDGEQSPGLYFTHDEKLYLARELDALGVSVIEAGVAGMGAEEQAVLRKLVRLNLKADILAWNRLTLEDLGATLRSGVGHAHFSVPTSPQLLSRKLGKGTSWVFGQMEAVLGAARREGLVVSLGAEDASRSDPEFLMAVFRHAQALGVSRVRYADTLGLLTPDRTARIVSQITTALSVPLDFHGHNDFGMATANALASWKAGAKMVSCSLLGLGERAGNTSLEEFIGAVHFLEGHFPEMNFLRLQKVSTALSYLSGRPIDPHRPLLGKEIFRHESGIHVDGLLKASETYEVYPPEKLGGRRRLTVGKHSGRSALKHLASQRGRLLSDDQAQAFLCSLRQRMSAERGIDSAAIFSDLLTSLPVTASQEAETA